MEVYKTVVVPEKVVPARTESVYVSTNCDICKEPISYGGYSANETEVYVKEGSNYPEGGMGTKVSFDICVTCFKEKLIPFIAGFGGTPTEEEWDW